MPIGAQTGADRKLDAKDRFAGRAYSAQHLRADLYRFTAVILAHSTEHEPAADPKPDC